MKEINKENTSKLLTLFIKENELEIRDVAKAINCSITTLYRIIIQETSPTENLTKQVGIMMAVGFDTYKTLSAGEKEKIAEKMGVFGGAALGIGTITSAVGVAGAVTGLSAAGISSGLAAIGGAVGGGMAIGVATVAFIPFVVGGIGYGLVKGVKAVISKNKLNEEEINPYWEYLETELALIGN